MSTKNRIPKIGLVTLGLAAAACGTDSSLVGGRCRAGYVDVGGNCLVAPNGAVQTFDPATSLPTTPAPAASASPQVTPAAVPGWVATTPIDPPFDPPADPTPICEAPLVSCLGQCISVDSDPLNCGACGRTCKSNICASRECVGATPGDVVLIGHDISKTTLAGSAHAKVLVNAVSIPTTSTLRVLSYEVGVDSDTSAWVRALVSNGITNRTVRFTTASAATIDDDNLYTRYDVVLVQRAAGDDPATLGARWAPALTKFTKEGGVFVGVDGGQSDMPALVRATGLLDVTSHVPLAASTHFVVSGASDVVGAQVLSPYAAFGSSVAFLGAEGPSLDVSWVVRTEDADSLPTVIHKIVR